MDRIGVLAARALDGEYADGALYFAIDLAVTLGDPTLRVVVEQLAEDPQVIKDRVSTTDRYARQLQEHAAARLSGAPALPQCCLTFDG